MDVDGEHGRAEMDVAITEGRNPDDKSPDASFAYGKEELSSPDDINKQEESIGGDSWQEEQEKEGEGESGEEGEGEEEENYRAPIIDSRNVTFKTRILNPYLVCSLCLGYLRDAFTVIECLHTYCKSCIYKYLCGHNECPQCGTNLGVNPFEKIKYDRQIQTFVDKVFPELVQKDLEAERAMLGIPVESVSNKAKAAEEPDSPATKKLKKSEAMKKFYSDEVAFELTLDEKEKDETLKILDKPFIRTSAKVTVKHLKKYLQKKLSLDLSSLEITYRGEVLGNEHSLEYILKSRGLDPNSKNPNFKYRMRKSEHLQVVT